MGARLGRAPAAAGARAHLRRQHLLSRAQHAGLFRGPARAGTVRRATALAGRRPDPDLQPRPAFRLRDLRGRGRAPGAPPDRPRRRRDPRRDHLRVSAVPHGSLRPSAAAADAVHSAHAVGVSSPAGQRPPARRRAVRRLCRVSDAVVRLLRHLPGSVPGGRLRDDADREGGAVAGADRRAGGGGRDRHGGDGAGRARLSRGAPGGGRAAERRDRQEQRDVAELPGTAGDQHRLREGFRALHGSGATAVSGVRGGRARARRAVAANTARTTRLCSRASVCLRPGADSRVRCLAGIQRRDLSRALRLLPAVQGAAHPGADGADGRLLAGDPRGLRRGAHRRAAAVAHDQARGADAGRRADADRVRVDADRALGGAAAAAAGLRRSRPRRRRRADLRDLRVSDRHDGGPGVSLLLDVPLAESGQRLQRLLSAVVRADCKRGS